jgi:hypothetical protein
VAGSGLARSNTLVLFPVLAPLTVTPDKIRGGSSASGSIMLRRQAPAAGITVVLSSSDPSVNLPKEVHLSEGQNTATFAISTRTVASEISDVITASYAGVARKATLTIVP